MDNEAPSLLRVRGLEKTFSSGRLNLTVGVEALDVPEGAIVGILGATSAGKSELLALLGGDEQPGRGSIELLGRPLASWPLAQRSSMISRLFEDDGLYQRLTVGGNLELFAELFGLPKAGKAVREIAEAMGLLDRLGVRIEKLPASFGRRVAIARALLVPARLLLLDEPDLRADLDTQRLVAQNLQTRVATPTDPPAVIVTSEDAAWLDTFCHIVYELQGGRIAGHYIPGEEKTAAPIKPFKIPARKEDRVVLYNPADILYAYSKDGRTYIRTAQDEAVCNLTLQELEQRLIPSGFFKAHRSYLVNLQHVVEVQPYTRNSFTIILNDAERTALPLSKQSKEELQELFGF